MARRLISIFHPRRWKPLWRPLPAVLVAAAFLAGLAAAAPHSVHHLGEDREQRQPECLGVLAWAAATCADCPASAITLDAPPETNALCTERFDHRPSCLVFARPCRAPPKLS
jgi:hypothetical protein